ncbi:MAG TPA: DUF3124 domain-containing protein, partial [Spirochaetota bacterium]
IITLLFILSCGNGKKENAFTAESVDFNPDSLVTMHHDAKTVRGQLLYMPVYSNLPYNSEGTNFDMKAYVAIHNTDLKKSITITKVIYFNQKGKPVYDFMKTKKISLGPLATQDFHIPYEDKSGIGANFLIEWVSGSPVSEPLAECVTVSLRPNHSLAITSRGVVIKEIK